MEHCEYRAVKTDDLRKDNGDTTPWKYFFRQLTIASALWTLYFSAGLVIGTPTVLIPQLRKANETIDDELASWLYSSFGIAAVPWVSAVPALSSFYGRKLPYLISCVCVVLSFITLYFSTSPYHILISEVIQGFTNACNITITVVIVSEYTDPKYRGVFLTIKSASFFWGIWVSNAIGTFLPWKYIAVVGLITSLYTFVGCLHPESPHWLASKGRYEECKASFRWLHGCSERSEKELRSIIEVQNNRESKRRWKRFKEELTCRQFYIPLGLTAVTSAQYHFSGKMVCSAYAIDIIKRMTDDESTAYTGMLILDGVTVLGMYFGSFLSKILKRRTLYMTSSFIGVSFLLMLSLYLYLVKLGVFEEVKSVSILLLTAYSLSMSCGPMIMSMTVTGEIIPLKYQSLCYAMNLSVFAIVYTLLLKFAPTIFLLLGVHGSFLFYGVTAGACTVVLYLYLPETKDITLLEIDELFSDRKGRDRT